MAGLNVGTSSWGKFRGSPESSYTPPPTQGGRGNKTSGINTGPTPKPSQFNPRGQMGGLNAGKGSQMHILPSGGPNDSFRQYGTVQGGRVIPPANPYAPPSNLPTGQGAGTWGPGPINAGPSIMPPQPLPIAGPIPNTNPWLDRGGFTGGQMPTSPYSDPGRANIPNMPPSGGMFGRGGGGFRGAYGSF